MLVTDSRHNACTLKASHRGRLTLAGLDALDPSVLKPGVAGIPALVEPSTAARTTTAFAGFLAQTTLGTLRTACHGCACRRGCFGGHEAV